MVSFMTPSPPPLQLFLSSPHSLSFLIPSPQNNHSVTNFKPLKLTKICSTPQLIQLQTQEDQKIIPNQKPTNEKKKRKPRPSFIQQIQHKWSLKNTSLRRDFPWEVKEQAIELIEEPIEEDEEQNLQLNQSQPEIEKITNKIELLNYPSKSKPPWAHGENPTNDYIQEPYNLVNEVEVNDKIENVKAEKLQKSNKFKELINVNNSNSEAASSNLPWEKVTDTVQDSIESTNERKSNTELSEKLIPEPELKRLRNLALRMVERFKVGASGITQELVNSIHEKWKNDEIVKLKFEIPHSNNMKRTHESLENKTGGLVIWRSGSSIVLYRGISYTFPCVKSYQKENQISIIKQTNDNKLSDEELMDLNEINDVLTQLGPRFNDWSGPEPLPIDADLLPGTVNNYKTPFRIFPHGVKRSLRDNEMTYYRQMARKIPPHFALGRNRELQGLALAMVKLWEKSAIAKIAIKRGVLNTLNERMAQELKVLTGGTLVSRNKDYIVFYRGNDFLSPKVKDVLLEAEKSAIFHHDEEEIAREKNATTFIQSKTKMTKIPLIAGTLLESIAAKSKWGIEPNKEDIKKMIKDSALSRHASLVKFLENKLAIAKGKIGKAEKVLRKTQQHYSPSDLPTDLETLSEAERFLFRKIGLSMKPYLVLGRRGVFDGTVENMHLHWKYREVVKIIVERKNLVQVKHIAINLEAESGGVLVCVEKSVKGYVIIVYRGKNYERPNVLKKKNLLTKRQALVRSIELQRREALKDHVWELMKKIEKIKDELEELKSVEEIDETTLYSRINNVSDDEDSEDDEDDFEGLE